MRLDSIGASDSAKALSGSLMTTSWDSIPIATTTPIRTYQSARTARHSRVAMGIFRAISDRGGIFFTGNCYRIRVNSGFGGVPIGAGGDPAMMFNFVDLPEC